MSPLTADDSKTQIASQLDGESDLTPNTKREAEEAFTFNSTYQTASAAAPQPTTPELASNVTTTATHNYLSAAKSAGLPEPEPPYPSDGLSPLFNGKPGGTLSRGTTQAVLQKMDSGEVPIGEALGRRATREGEKRTSNIGVDGLGQGKGIDGATGADFKPSFDRKASYNREDLKRVVSERWMKGTGEGEDVGFTSNKED